MKATSENSRRLSVRLRMKISGFRGFCVTYRLVLDWVIGFIDAPYTHSELQAVTAISLIYVHALQFTVTRALWFSAYTSRILATDFISLTVTSNHTDWSASRPGRYTSRKRAPGTRWLEDWMLARAGLDSVEKRKSLPLPPAGNGTPDVQPVPRSYINLGEKKYLAILKVSAWFLPPASVNCPWHGLLNN
jgi:hypothetical protein